MKPPIQYVLNLITQFAQSGGLHHSRGCQLMIPAIVRHSSNDRECTCGARELNALVEGEVLKGFVGKGAVQIGEIEFRSYASFKRHGLMKLYCRDRIPFARLTKTGEAFVRDHDKAMGLTPEPQAIKKLSKRAAFDAQPGKDY